jgi:membrane protein implicated in regulation of membrane protease activity
VGRWGWAILGGALGLGAALLVAPLKRESAAFSAVSSLVLLAVSIWLWSKYLRRRNRSGDDDRS